MPSRCLRPTIPGAAFEILDLLFRKERRGQMFVDVFAKCQHLFDCSSQLL